MVIYAKDIQQILRCSQQTASNKLRAVKAFFKKADYQYITITEFCNYFGIPEVEVHQKIKA